MKQTFKSLLPWDTLSFEIIGSLSVVLIGIFYVLGIDNGVHAILDDHLFGTLVILIGLLHIVSLNRLEMLPLRTSMCFVGTILYLWLMLHSTTGVLLGSSLCLFAGFAYSFLLNFTTVVRHD